MFVSRMDDGWMVGARGRFLDAWHPLLLFYVHTFFLVIGRTGNIDSTTYIFHTLWYLDMMVHNVVTKYSPY
jgi:hypothetical protein